MTTWHIDPLIAYQGRPYPMQNRRLGDWPHGSDINGVTLGLTAEQQRTSVAVHELGHALTWLRAGIHVCAVRRYQVECRQSREDQASRRGHLVGLVSGERAADRWLREAGLWTPDLAVLTEYGGASDRAQVLAMDITPAISFGAGGTDYSVLLGWADEALDVVWPQLMAAVPHLLAADEMTGDQLADLIGMTNPHHP